MPLFLQVTDPHQVLLFRGDEAHVPAPQLVIYREIVLGDVRQEPCPPPPPPTAEQVTVPSVVGRRAEEAIRILQASGLHVGQVRQVYNDQVGIVLAQEPAAGQSVPEDTAVDLLVGSQRPTIRDEIITRIGRAPEFEQLGVSGQDLGNRFQALGIESREQVAALLDRPDPELRQALGLSSIRRVQLFKRMLRQVLENPEA